MGFLRTGKDTRDVSHGPIPDGARYHSPDKPSSIQPNPNRICSKQQPLSVCRPTLNLPCPAPALIECITRATSSYITTEFQLVCTITRRTPLPLHVVCRLSVRYRTQPRRTSGVGNVPASIILTADLSTPLTKAPAPGFISTLVSCTCSLSAWCARCRSVSSSNPRRSTCSQCMRGLTLH